METRILLADDHGVLRAGLRSLLNAEPGLTVVGEAENCDQAINLALSLKPDVVLMDISMPGMGGLAAMRQILEQQKEARVLLLTVHEDSSLVREAVQSGASGYILKRAVESELISAIKAVARGEMYIYPAMTRALLEESPGTQVEKPEPATLTLREVDVLKLIAKGYTNRQIADKLCLSVRTVESHRANLMGKLGLKSRVELVHYAMWRGLLDQDESFPQ